MASIKTAISLQQPLFEQVETMAHELKISRSRLFALAIEEFIRQHQNQHMLEQINAAYDDAPDPSEQALRQGMRQRHQQLLESNQ